MRDCFLILAVIIALGECVKNDHKKEPQKPAKPTISSKQTPLKQPPSQEGVVSL